MSQPPADLAALVAHLSDLRDRAAGIWERYLQVGPGRVPPELFDELIPAANGLKPLLNDSQLSAHIGAAGVDTARLEAAIDQACEFARRCATTPIGLSFVSGEAGLIPRRDQHQSFAAAVCELEQAVKVLRRFVA